MAWDDTKTDFDGSGDPSSTEKLPAEEYNAMVAAIKARAEGAASSTDNALARFDLATGKVLQNSLVIVSDEGAISTPAGQGIGIGLGSTPPSYLLHIKGTSATDLPTYSAEFLDADNWTSTGWTGSWAAGWTHTAGNTTVLSHDHAAVNATKYQITYTVSGTVGSGFTITFGGQTSPAITASGAWGPTTTGTGVLQITPASNFAGTIVISIKSITAAITPVIYLTNSSDVFKLAVRISNSAGYTFFGAYAGEYITTGQCNTGYGSFALQQNTTGYNNTAMGRAALNAHTVGYQNSAFGYWALYTLTSGYNNTAIGAETLRVCSTGYSNCGIGANSLYSLTTGYQNAGVGAGSLRSLTTGYNNVGVGYLAGWDANQKVDAVNSMALGYGSFTTRSNQVVIGDENVIETQLRTGVYIGSTSTTAHTQPTARLHIAAGSATAGTAPIKLTAGTVLGTPEAGAIEFDGTNLYFTNAAGARQTLAVVA